MQSSQSSRKTDDALIKFYLAYIAFISSSVEYIPFLKTVNFLVFLIPFLLWIREFYRFQLKKITVLPILIIVSGLLSWLLAYDVSFSEFFNSFRWSCLVLFILFWGSLQSWSDEKRKEWLHFIFTLFILQIPIGLAKHLLFFQAFGEGSYEMPLGLLGHSTTTFFVAIAIIFVVAYRQEKLITFKKHLFLLLGYFSCGIVGGKRALILLLPACIIFTTTIHSVLSKKWKILFKSLIFSSVAILIIVYLTIRLLPTLNPTREIWGEIDLTYLVEYLQEHNSTEQFDRFAMAVGRASATQEILTLQFQNPSIWLWGYGVGFLARSAENNFATSDFRIEYGINGYIWTSLQWGIPGAIFWFILLFSPVWNGYFLYKKTTDPYWKAFAVAMIVSGFLMGPFQFYYAPVLKSVDFMSFYYFVMLILYQKVQETSNSSEENIQEHSNTANTKDSIK